MKKYLMTVMAAVALGGLFTGCSSDADLSGGNTAEFNIVQNYEKAFVTRFGQPAANQNWGFGGAVAGTRGHNANANEWADPDKEYGGWVVPDPLTDDQKLRVKAYFQAIQNPGGTSCNYKDFFVQQVYKGNPSTAGSNSPEQYKSANNGWVVGSNHMDHLTAGSIHDHINNFNYGDYSGGGTVTVLDNGQHVNGGTTHQDQIMLMVNSQTDCFGYWNSDGSLGHDDRYRLVSAEVIDQWAKDYGNNIGAAVVDKWNRSFIGFDFDQVAGDDVYAKNGSNFVYAKYSETPGSPQYAYTVSNRQEDDILEYFTGRWGEGSVSPGDNDVVIYSGAQYGGLVYAANSNWSEYDKLVIEYEQPTEIETQILIQRSNGDSYSETVGANSTKLEISFAGKDMSSVTNVALQPMEDGTNKPLYISRIYLVKETGTIERINTEYIMYNNKQVPYLTAETNQYCGHLIKLNDTDLKINKYVSAINSNQDCLNMAKINELLAAGYLPVSGSNMKDWVKVQGGADGYYSDWIVTICKANGGSTPPPPVGFICRVIAEDLTVGENTDFDFNDVVFDVYSNGVIRIRACGGTLPLRVDGREVHGLFGKETGDMINTGWNGVSIDYENTYRDIKYSGGSIANAAAANGILVEVQKQSGWIPLDAPVGEVASKIAVGNNYEWCRERQDIDSKWHLRSTGYKPFSDYVKGIVIGNEWYEMVIREAAKYQNKGNQ